MKELIIEYLNAEFYYSSVDNYVYATSDDKFQFGYKQIQRNIIDTFDVDKELAYDIVFNWLLSVGVKLVRKDWNDTYITHNTGVLEHHETTITEDIDFKYKLILDEQ